MEIRKIAATVSSRNRRSRVGLLLATVLCASALQTIVAGGQEPSEGGQPEPAGMVQPPPENDLDAFMARVLERREIDWDRLHNYVFRERERLEIKSNLIPALENLDKEYVWRVRDGYLVRTPVKANGVSISREEQAKAESEWIERQKRRKRGSLEREAFFGFKFQPGRYLYAGKKTVGDRELTVIEYYPDFRDDEDRAAKKGESRGQKRSKAAEEDYERMFEKAFIVTMLVLPEEHQIVEMTFDNVGLDFLPGRWLVRVADIQAALTMDKPYGDVWLPKTISAWGSITTANGDLTLRYSREFFDYQQTDVKVKFWYERPSPQSDEK